MSISNQIERLHHTGPPTTSTFNFANEEHTKDSIYVPSKQRKRLRDVVQSTILANRFIRLTEQRVSESRSFGAKLKRWLLPHRQRESLGAVPPFQLKYCDMDDGAKSQLHEFLMEYGNAMRLFGAPAFRVQYHLLFISNRLEMNGVSVQPSATGLFFGFGKEVHLVPMYEIGEINLKKLCKLEDIGNDLMDGLVTVAEARELVEQQTEKRSPFSFVGQLMQLVATVCATVCMAILYDATWVEMIASIVCGLITASIMLLTIKIPRIQRLSRVISSASASIVGVATKWLVYTINKRKGATAVQDLFHPLVSELLITLSAITVLIPGMRITTGMTEVASGNYSSGGAHLISSTLSILELAFGIMTGIQFDRLIGFLLNEARYFEAESVQRLGFPRWVALLVIPILSMSLMVRMKAPRYPLAAIFILLTSFLSFFITLGGKLLLAREMGSFLGMVVATLMGNLYSKLSKHPSAIVIGTSVALLLPGSIAVRGLYSLLSSQVASASISYAAVMTAISVVVGFTVANAVFPMREEIFSGGGV